MNYKSKTNLIKTSVYDLVRDDLKIVGEQKPRVYKITKVLVGHDVPNAVAREHKELVMFNISVELEDLRLGRHELLAGTSSFHIFVLVVAQSPGHRQAAVDPLDHDAAPRPDDSLALRWQHGFVVAGVKHRVPRSAEHRPRVATVRDVDVARRDERADRRRAGLVHARAHLRQLAHLVVQPQKPVVNAVNHVLGLELLGFHNALEEMLRAVHRNRGARVPIENGKVTPVGQTPGEACDHSVSVLHLHPPTLHRRDAVTQPVTLAMLVVLLGFWRVQKCPHGR